MDPGPAKPGQFHGELYNGCNGSGSAHIGLVSDLLNWRLKKISLGIADAELFKGIWEK